MTRSISLEDFTAHAKELRGRLAEAEREFLDYLVWGESQNFWRNTGLTYLQLLDQLNLVKPARYDAHKRMTTQHGDAAAKVSVNALVEAAKFKEPAAQREILDQAAKWEETNETPISPQSAASIGRDLRSRIAATVTRNKSYNTVVAELETARREVERLTTENKNLRAEIAALKRQHAPAAKKTTRTKAQA